MSLDLAFIGDLVIFELLHEVIDLFFLLVENFVLLGIVFIALLFLQILLNLLDVLLVGLNCGSLVIHILFSLFNLGIVLLDPVEESFSGFREG